MSRSKDIKSCKQCGKRKAEKDNNKAAPKQHKGESKEAKKPERAECGECEVCGDHYSPGLVHDCVIESKHTEKSPEINSCFLCRAIAECISHKVDSRECRKVLDDVSTFCVCETCLPAWKLDHENLVCDDCWGASVQKCDDCGEIYGEGPKYDSHVCEVESDEEDPNAPRCGECQAVIEGGICWEQHNRCKGKCGRPQQLCRCILMSPEEAKMLREFDANHAFDNLLVDGFQYGPDWEKVLEHTHKILKFIEPKALALRSLRAHKP